MTKIEFLEKLADRLLSRPAPRVIDSCFKIICLSGIHGVEMQPDPRIAAIEVLEKTKESLMDFCDGELDWLKNVEVTD